MGKRNRSAQQKDDTRTRHRQASQPGGKPAKLRIIGGQYRGRILEYSGDLRTRPMKDNIREAVFNLIGAWIPGKHVFDLFAGTGAIGLEALSRGAIHTTFIERHIPTAKIIRKNLQTLDAEHQASVETRDSFFWARQFFNNQVHFPSAPWATFISPPYSYFADHTQDLLWLISSFMTSAPPESVIVVESDNRFDVHSLPEFDRWRIKTYSPAQIAILRGPSVMAL